MIRGMFHQTNYFTQLVLTLAIAFLMNVIATFFAMAIAIPLYHLDVTDFTNIFTNLDDPGNIAVLKFFQIILSLCGFVFTALMLAYIFSHNTSQYLWLEQKPQVKFMVIAILFVTIVFPFINFLGALNSEIHFPGFLKGLENYLTRQDQVNEQLMDRFLADSNLGGLFVNIVMIAIIPAVGEELFFRGIVQNVFIGMTKNHHWGIWIAATIFSLIHMQFTGFLPRLVLGATFGYMLVWSRSIWVPILAHFINNISAVIMYYFVNTGHLKKDSLEYGSTTDVWPVIILSVLFSVLLFRYFYKNAVKADDTENTLQIGERSL